MSDGRVQAPARPSILTGNYHRGRRARCGVPTCTARRPAAGGRPARGRPPARGGRCACSESDVRGYYLVRVQDGGRLRTQTTASTPARHGV